MLPEFGPHERHVAIGMWAATGGIAAAAGPPLGGLLVQADWRLVFLVNVPVGLRRRSASACARCVERRELGRRTPRLLGAVAADRGDRLARRRDRQGPGMGLELTGDPRAARAHRGAAAGDLAALGAPGGADRRPGDAARAQLRAGRGGLGAVLRAASARCCSRRAVPHGRVARERADGRPDAVPRPGDGDRLQRALGAAGRALRLPHPGLHRIAHVRRGERVVHTRPGTGRHT